MHATQQTQIKEKLFTQDKSYVCNNIVEVSGASTGD